MARKAGLELLDDYKTYAENLLRIKTKEQGLQPLRFNPSQLKMYALIQRAKREQRPLRVAQLKARQVGSTTFWEGHLFYSTVSAPYTNSLIVAHDRESTESIFDISRIMREELPREFRPMTRRANKFEMIFENPDERTRLARPGLRSTIEVRTAGNKEAGRGSMFHHLLLSEVASWPDPELLWASLYPTVPTNPMTSIVLESTAKGATYWWHDFYVKSKNGETGFMPLFLPWFLDPGYALKGAVVYEWMPDDAELDEDEQVLVKEHHLTREQLAFRRSVIAAQGIDYFHQEYPSNDEEAWLGIGTPVFNRKTVREMYERALLTKPEWSGVLSESGEMRSHPEGEFVIFERPQPKEPDVDYILGVDVAQGAEGGSQAAIQVLKRGRKQRQVARWSKIVNPIQLVPYIFAIAVYYNEALVSIEVNSPGIATQEVFSRSYPRNFRWRYLDTRLRKPTEKVGWYTSAKTKELLTAHFHEMLERGDIEILDAETLKQVYGMAYAYPKGNMEPEPGVGDDLFMAAMIGSYSDHVDAGYIRTPEIASITSTPEEPQEGVGEQERKVDRHWYKDMWDPFAGNEPRY